MIPRLTSKVNFFIVFVTLISGLFVYFYIYKVQQKEEWNYSAGDRCKNEITMLKYQLTAVTNYKEHIEKLLAETRKTQEMEKEKFKDVMESCYAMHQQVSLCQSQFEDLKSECRKAKETVSQLSKDLENLKKPR